MMNPWTLLRCRWAARHLDRYLDRTLGEPDRRRLAAHLVTCLHCRDSERNRRAIRAGLRALRPDVDPAAVRRLETSLRDLSGPTR